MSKTITTNVGTATLLEDKLIEVKIHSGIELDKSNLIAGYEQLEQMAGGDYVLLVNRTVSDYSISFGAMTVNASHPKLLAQALLIPPYNTHKRMVAEILVSFPRQAETPIELFMDRLQAIEWLRAHRDRHLLPPATS